jgi:PAS domain S-box-containing protein
MRDEFQELLIIDDSPGDVLLLRTMLERAFQGSLSVRVAGTLAEALTVLSSSEPPVVLLDLGLPDSLGEETYHRVRRLVPDGVIVVLSGNTDDSLAVSLVREGAQDYLVKGRFDSDLLRRVIQYAWERHQIEQELVERHAWWEALVRSIPDAVVISDHEDRILLANPAALTLFGATLEQIRELTVPTLYPIDVRALVRQELESLKREFPSSRTVIPHQIPVLGADGKPLPTEVVRFAFQSRRDRLIVSVCRDIRERKNLEQLLLRSQTMDALGQLTAGVSHDFNNLLGIVMGNLDLLKMEVSEQPAVSKRLDTARSAASRGADLVKRLLAFSRTRDLTPTWNALDEVVTAFLKMASRTIGPDIIVETALASTLPEVYLDRAELENVLLNLTVNARDAMPHGGKIVFSTRAFDLGPGDATVRSGDLPPGQYVSLTVADTGTGMSKEVLDRALEPFFTTKETGKGTGLGLSMVYGFARQSGGSVELQSEVGVGTSVHLVFPATGHSGPAETAVAEAPVHHAPAGATALVVDDEPGLLDVISTYLKNLGYSVTSAANGPAALTQLERAPFTLFITDVLMPGGLDGGQLARRARELQPGIRVVFTSGFPTQALAGKQVVLDSVLLAKPYSLADLQKALNEVFAPAI